MEIRREDYLQILESATGKTDLVKVITGMRRTGKTTVMLQHLEHLRGEGIPEERICYIDLDLMGREVTPEELGVMVGPCLEHDGRIEPRDMSACMGGRIFASIWKNVIFCNFPSGKM